MLAGSSSHAEAKITVFNLGTDEYCRGEGVRGLDFTSRLGLYAGASAYAGGERGWVGDVPFIFLDARTASGRLAGQPPLQRRLESASQLTVDWLEAERLGLYEGRRADLVAYMDMCVFGLVALRAA